jgi:endogenous inhibitor of DNA gyrase (YacG/DUF329 family)
MIKVKISRKCATCGKTFQVIPSKVDRKYCSSKCCHQNRPNEKVERKCKVCGNIFQIKPSVVKKGFANYCSYKCRNKAYIGVKHSLEHCLKISKALKGKYIEEKCSTWKGGICHVNGYIYILSRNHPFKNIDNYVPKHRLVMEKHLGRFLDPKEIIHHNNKIRNDNRLQNLTLFPNRSEHRKFHLHSDTVPL